MSIPDLLEKINASGGKRPGAGGTSGSPDPAQGRTHVPLIYIILVVFSLILGLSGWGEAIYIVQSMGKTEPVSIECSAEYAHAMEKPRASTTESLQGSQSTKSLNTSAKKTSKKTSTTTKSTKKSKKTASSTVSEAS